MGSGKTSEPEADTESATSGVKAFSIIGRLIHERERLLGMTDQERAWRAQYLKDQILSPNEPRHVPEYWHERTNIIRRFYRAPLDAFGRALEPVIGVSKASHVRYYTGKICILLGLIYMGRYYFKYNAHDWTRRGGWNVMTTKQAVYPGDPGFPAQPDRHSPQDYSNRNFKNSPI